MAHQHMQYETTRCHAVGVAMVPDSHDLRDATAVVIHLSHLLHTAQDAALERCFVFSCKAGVSWGTQ